MKFDELLVKLLEIRAQLGEQAREVAAASTPCLGNGDTVPVPRRLEETQRRRLSLIVPEVA